MKLLSVISMMLCAVSGFRFRDVISDHIDISPHNECADHPDGMRLPHADCNRFILCDGQVGLVLTCRGSEPHFDRCSQRCVRDPLVCDITDCNGGGGGGGELTTTTTTFIPPTVPVTCPTPCDSSNFPVDTCDCIERWTCINSNCQCDINIPCPVTIEQCMADAECGQVCADRCVCNPDDICQCNKELECPFPEAECPAKCGCAINCNCNDDRSLCTCNEDCLCPSPPNVCPFTPNDCEERCGCDERCICNGNVCTCDAETHCPTPALRSFWYKN